MGTPLGCGPGIAAPAPPGAPPCAPSWAWVGIDISVTHAIKRTKAITFAFATFLEKRNFLFSFHFIAK
jgi:hypothetical protein